MGFPLSVLRNVSILIQLFEITSYSMVLMKDEITLCGYVISEQIYPDIIVGFASLLQILWMEPISCFVIICGVLVHSWLQVFWDDFSFKLAITEKSMTKLSKL